jgi:5-methylcytosine-specific restriction endonuclease McrA
MFRAERLALAEPSVVRLCYFVKVPYQARVALNRRAVFARDGHRCQYCGASAENIDHVIPRSKGGSHAWENVVASCRPCNARKRDRLLEDSGMRLRRRPAPPRERTWILVASGSVRSDWEPYLGPRTASLSA